MTMEYLIDPRGKQRRTRIKLAPRTSVETLRERRVLFYNNTKLDFGAYTEVFPRIKKQLEQKGVRGFIDYRETVWGKTSEGLRVLAQKLTGMGASAVVVALADIGVTPASTILTAELEKAGLPSVLITAGPGIELSRAVAHYRAGCLCLCPLNIYQGNTRQEVDREPPAENGLPVIPPTPARL